VPGRRTPGCQPAVPAGSGSQRNGLSKGPVAHRFSHRLDGGDVHTPPDNLFHPLGKGEERQEPTLVRRINSIVLGALALLIASAIDAQAASVPGVEQIVISHTALSGGDESYLKVQLDKAVGASNANQIKNSLQSALLTSLPSAGPTGNEFLVCNKTHSFSDADGTFDIISYSDNFTFEIEVGGQTGNADLDIRGSFYSAK
jgi:hypothetical protein